MKYLITKYVAITLMVVIVFADILWVPFFIAAKMNWVNDGQVGVTWTIIQFFSVVMCYVLSYFLEECDKLMLPKNENSI